MALPCLRDLRPGLAAPALPPSGGRRGARAGRGHFEIRGQSAVLLPGLTSNVNVLFRLYWGGTRLTVLCRSSSGFVPSLRREISTRCLPTSAPLPLPSTGFKVYSPLSSATP